jgi:hypothetical protein
LKTNASAVGMHRMGGCFTSRELAERYFQAGEIQRSAAETCATLGKNMHASFAKYSKCATLGGKCACMSGEMNISPAVLNSHLNPSSQPVNRQGLPGSGGTANCRASRTVLGANQHWDELSGSMQKKKQEDHRLRLVGRRAHAAISRPG